MLAANVATFGLRGFQRCEHALGEVAFGVLERARHCGGHGGLVHQVCLDGEPSPSHVAGCFNRLRARVHGDVTRRVDKRDLAHIQSCVGSEQAFERFLRRLATAHQLEPQRTIRWVDE